MTASKTNLELRRVGCYKSYLQYTRYICNVEACILRVKFLENCLKSDIIPKFLKFRAPNNVFFHDESVYYFQRPLLRKEIVSDKSERISFCKKQALLHSNKLRNLYLEQDRPLLNVSKTVITYGLNYDLPKYLMDTFSLGPKSADLDKVNPKNILAEIDLVLDFCKSNNLDDGVILDINVKTLAYIKRCQKQKEPRHIMMTNRYLKDNYLLAIPFDKGVGICVMKKETYHSKLDQIISLP